MKKNKTAPRKYNPQKPRPSAPAGNTIPKPIKKLEVADDVVATLSSPLTAKYPPPPGKTNHFMYYWNTLVPEIAERDNFKTGHLLQLAVLCDLYVQKDTLDNVINTEGYSYISAGTHGASVERVRPEVRLLNAVVDDIKDYTKMLGLLLYKDTSTKPEEGEQDWE
jgi:hypothetical protein